MCRKKKECSQLGINPQHWSKTSPLPPLQWFESQLDLFQVAVEHFTSNNREQCLLVLSKIRNDDMKTWFIEHGQMSGDHRVRQIKHQMPPSLEETQRDPLRNPKKHEAQVFLRDGFKCRYCGLRLISNEFLRKFIKVLNTEGFRKGPRNIDTHGIIHIFNPVADHVIPWSMGGKTDMANLVTSCGACNYGKAGYTIEQLGITNPMSRSPLIDNWDGLLSKIQTLKLGT